MCLKGTHFNGSTDFSFIVIFVQTINIDNFLRKVMQLRRFTFPSNVGAVDLACMPIFETNSVV